MRAKKVPPPKTGPGTVTPIRKVSPAVIMRTAYGSEQAWRSIIAQCQQIGTPMVIVDGAGHYVTDMVAYDARRAAGEPEPTRA